MPTLYIIDGYAQFFRAYHAIRTPMTSPVTKEPTNMTFGFIGMLLKLLRGQGRIGADGGKPDYVVITLDVSGDRGTFRSQLYADYKATRSAPPEDLFPQVERCLAMLRQIGMPILGAEGFEADDVIATLITQLRAKHPDLKIRIISKDKDLKQLLAAAPSPVEMYDVHNDELITAETLMTETGLTPPQVIDMLSLMGDTVDNVPGVEGVGPKTAAKLVAEHGSLDAVLAAAATIKGKLGERLRATPREALDLSRQLVTLRHDVPVELPLESARTDKLDLLAMGPVLKELGFNRYQDELKALAGGSGTGILPVHTPHSLTPRPTHGGLFPDRAPIEMPLASAAAHAAARTAAKPAPIFGGLFDSTFTGSGAALITPQSGEYRAITTRAQLDDLLKELRAAECIAIDTETTGLSPRRDKLVGICLSTKIGTGVYIPVRSPDPSSHLDEAAVIAALKPILEDPAKPKCGHNLKFEMLVLRKAGIRLGGASIPTSDSQRATTQRSNFSAGATSSHSTYATPRFASSTAFDSMIASYLIDASRSSHGLDALSMAMLGRTNISIKDLIGSGADSRTFDQVPLDQATQYAAEDADVALQLRAMMLPQLAAMNLDPLFETVEMPLVEVLAELEWNGICVDRAELERQRMRLQKRIEELKLEIAKVTRDTIGRTFNPDSPKQLAAVLFNKPDASDESGGPGLGLKPIKKIKTGYSTDAEVLDKLATDPEISTPIPALIVEYRELTKLVSTYLVALAAEINPDTGRIHASFNQTVAATGRLSSSDPNLQNIPIRTDIGREIRRAFVAAPDHVLISADYSQIELRLLAHLSRDPALIEAFEKDQDIHTAVAAQIHNVPLVSVTKAQRNGAKMVNFGIVYGITSFGLARRLGVSNTEAGKIIDDYKRRFSGITTFLQECIDQAVRFGYVQTMLGRRRPIIDIESTNPQRRALAERVAINSVVQGSAADLIKLAMVDLQGMISTAAPPMPPGLHMLLQIHDELVFECPRYQADAAKSLIKHRMEHAMELSVPLKVEASVSDNWFDGK